MKTIGFVGLGSMGLPMAGNLVRRGFSVRGFDTRLEAVDAFRRVGGIGVASAAEAARGADALLLMVVNASQADDVLFNGGALAALPENAIVALMATCPPRAVELIADRVEAAGRRFVDAPVSGGVRGAEAATLSVMTAAAQAAFERIKPALEAVGDRVFHVGEKAGQGATAKAVNQLLCGVHLAVAAEALAFAAKLGVDLGVMLEILGGSSAASWMLKDRGPRIVGKSTEVTSAVDIFVKDLGIVLEAGRDAKFPLPHAALAHQLFLAVSGQGKGALDDSQIVLAYRGLSQS